MIQITGGVTSVAVWGPETGNKSSSSDDVVKINIVFTVGIVLKQQSPNLGCPILLFNFHQKFFNFFMQYQATTPLLGLEYSDGRDGSGRFDRLQPTISL